MGKWRFLLILLFVFGAGFYVLLMSSGEEDYLQGREVTSSKVNLRSGPGMEYQVIAKVTKGKSLDVVEKKGDWLRIRWKGGREGWIHEKLVKATSPSTIRVSVDRENLRKIPREREEVQARKPRGPGKKVEKDKVFIFRKVRLTDRLGMVKVTGEMANHSEKDFLAAGFMISFFDVNQQLLGIGEIVIDDFAKGETKPFTTYVEDVSYHHIDRYHIQFDFGI